MKKISIYSLVALFTLVNIGCGGGSDTPATQSIVQNNTQAASVSGLKSLKESAKLDDIDNSGMNKSVDKASNSEIENENATTLCNTGKIDFTSDEPSKVITFNAVKCKDDTSELDGAVSVKFNEDAQEEFISATATVTRNISFKDTKNSFSLEKGASVNIEDNKFEDAESYTLNAAFKSMINNVIFNVSDFEVTTTESSQGFNASPSDTTTATVKISSGKFNIGQYYFKIDESKTNTITNGNGTIAMTDGAGHKVELVLDNETVKLKVDQNGDGSFSDNETLQLIQ